MAIVQLRHDTPGRAYYRKKLAAGKTPMEAMRALKRRLSDVVYHRLVVDQRRQLAGRDREMTAGPGGHSGTATGSSAAGSNPNTDASEKSLPGPTTPEPTTLDAHRSSPATDHPRRRATTVAQKQPQALST